MPEPLGVGLRDQAAEYRGVVVVEHPAAELCGSAAALPVEDTSFDLVPARRCESSPATSAAGASRLPVWPLNRLGAALQGGVLTPRDPVRGSLIASFHVATAAL